MNKEYVLFNLREAKEELDKTINEIETDSEYGYGDFIIAMRHLYHHINTAWNAQNETIEATRKCSQKDFDRWRKFPEDIQELL